MFIVYSAAVMRIEAASGNTSPPRCQTARSTATMRMKPTPAATVAHRAESIGISTASTAPPMIEQHHLGAEHVRRLLLQIAVEHPGDQIGMDLHAGEDAVHRRRAQVLQARRGGADQGDFAP